MHISFQINFQFDIIVLKTNITWLPDTSLNTTTFPLDNLFHIRLCCICSAEEFSNILLNLRNLVIYTILVYIYIYIICTYVLYIQRNRYAIN